jgi:NAD(P)-dependent dehydrogenase (short-subunit alcohol dehydrogenase family)
MTGKVAIVTGGSAGIGRSICLHMLDAGWTVLSMARRATEIDHPRLHSIEVDLGDVAATREAAAIACGLRPAGLATTIAALVAMSPCAGSRGGSTATAERSRPAGKLPSAAIWVRVSTTSVRISAKRFM